MHIRDNLDLGPTQYRISVHGVSMGEGEVFPDRELAINPGQVFGDIEGVKTKDPTFGLDALWIDPINRDAAQTVGYTVVDSSTVIATHLSQLLRNNAQKLIGQDGVQQLLDRLKQTSPKLVENLVPGPCPWPISPGWSTTFWRRVCRSGICALSPRRWPATGVPIPTRCPDRLGSGRPGTVHIPVGQWHE